MRSLLLAILVAAAGCHGTKQTGPAWPAPPSTADDGGESIEPKATSVASSVEKSEDADDDDGDEKSDASAAKTGASEDKPAASSSPTVSQPTEPVMLDDEIIIEVDD